jgi:predicted AlkP superfamily phosphohydrolase/phosphomutase
VSGARKFWRAGLILAALAFAFHARSAETSAPRFDRVIVLGIDGVDYGLLRKWMDDGLLPNFSRLAAMGDFRPLQTSMPPQSPVAWSNFMTGMNSGGHGIFEDRKSVV